MRWLLLVAVALVCLVASGDAVQRLFLGGTFSGLDGIRSQGFAGWDADEGKWLEALMNPSATIHDMDAVRGGLFVAGSFSEIDNKDSSNIAFWDGHKWCAIRQGVDGEATSVWCDSDSSCWVAGSFSNIVNLQDSEEVTNFAHYTFNEAANEWQFDVTQRGWSHISGNVIGGRVDDASLVVMPGSTHFFLSTDGYDTGSGTFTNGRTIWRGSRQDNGFWRYVDGGDLNGASVEILDFSIDLSVDSPVLYMVTNNGTDQATSTLMSTVSLTFPCQSDPCVPPLTTSANYTNFASLSVNTSILQSYHRVYAAPNDVRYLIATYDPDGADSEYVARQRVMQQTGSGVPTLVGSPFEVGTGTSFLRPATPLALLADGRLLAQGSFEAANLYYPPSPVTTDSSGVTADRRSLDRVSGFAAWNGSLWQEAFGGGFGGGSHPRVRWAYDNSSNQYFFAGSSIRYAYNTRADKAAWFDDDGALSVPLFPLFDRNVLTRTGGGVDDGAVWTIVCDTSSCEDVFVGGEFTFHGEQVIGSVARVAVTREGPATPEEVGGGLWSLIVGQYDDDASVQRKGGRVYELVRERDYLYAGGQFERGGPATATVCLHNIARIDTEAADGVWEDLDGGCDAIVADVQFYNGRLYAAGEFQHCGGKSTWHVASYNYQDETPEWSSLRVGLGGPAYALEVFQGRLIVSGGFTNAGGLPVTGIASWDGFQWRALLPACTDDCVGTQPFYYDALATPSAVYDLRADPSGDFLWARAEFADATNDYLLLSRWEPTNGDFGRWTAKGNQINYYNDFEVYGNQLAFLSRDVVVVAGDPDDDPFRYANGHISPYNTQLDNWYAGFRTQSEVFVVAEGRGAAAALSSPLASLLAFF